MRGYILYNIINIFEEDNNNSWYPKVFRMQYQYILWHHKVFRTFKYLHWKVLMLFISS